MFAKILLPTDGSQASLVAARTAGTVAEAHDGVVHPLVAVEYRYIEDDDLPEHIRATIRERIDRRARAALQQASAAAVSAGGRSSPGSLRVGPAPDAILQEAAAGEYDLIVMSSRGLGKEQGHERLVGSVTERVLHRASCPVLVIPHE